MLNHCLFLYFVCESSETEDVKDRQSFHWFIFNKHQNETSCTFSVNLIIFSKEDLASWHTSERTSDGGNGNHSVSLPIILVKIKVDQMLSSSYISSLLVSI